MDGRTDRLTDRPTNRRIYELRFRPRASDGIKFKTKGEWNDISNKNTHWLDLREALTNWAMKNKSLDLGGHKSKTGSQFLWDADTLYSVSFRSRSRDVVFKKWNLWYCGQWLSVAVMTTHFYNVWSMTCSKISITKPKLKWMEEGLANPHWPVNTYATLSFS